MKPPALVIAVNLLLCAAAAPAAAETPDPSQIALWLQDRGIVLYERGEFGEATKLFAATQSLLPDKANPYRWLGLSEARRGLCREAIAHLDIFVGMVPVGDPRVAEVTRVRAGCNPGLVGGTLIIESQPTGAEVRIDRDEGVALGVTPYRDELASGGERKVYLRKAGFAMASDSITVEAGQSARLKLSLAPADASLEVAAAPVERGSRWWIIPIVAVVAAAAGAAIAIAVIYGGPREPMFASIPVTR